MKLTLPIDIEPQPTDSACGATCLQALYKFWNDQVTVAQIMSELPQLENGGTLAVQLACHARERGYAAKIFTYNVRVFDPTWFQTVVDLPERLRLQNKIKGEVGSRLTIATECYLRFLELGGEILMQPLERELIRQHMVANLPVLAGVSATFLYQEARERPHPPNENGISGVPDDVGGNPVGHFVILNGFDSAADSVLISDPLHPNPKSPEKNYWSSIDHVATAILLGIVTYDSNLLVIQPK